MQYPLTGRGPAGGRDDCHTFATNILPNLGATHSGMIRLTIKGIVQGVGFRPAVYRTAVELGSCGYVQNKGSHVEVVIDCHPAEFVKALRANLPPLARIDKVARNQVPAGEIAKMRGQGFRIIPSQKGEGAGVFQAIPADTGTCNNCLHEMFEEGNRRYLYPFINCTDCGARFSVIEGLPYDRPKTAMHEFPLCPTCLAEYTRPGDRRFHAQTISCVDDGPRYGLFDSAGGSLARHPEQWKTVKEFCDLINTGKTGIVKSWGGMHHMARMGIVWRFREMIKRKNKPLAIMAKDLRSVESIAHLTDHEVELLTSPRRPIVLLRKRDDLPQEQAELLEGVSPGLDTVGVFLPYTPLHYMLFSFLDPAMVIMTSANPSGEPMIVGNEQVFLYPADFYLLHDRRIVNRCDDSVIKSLGDRSLFIRRSRGYVPEPIEVGRKGQVISVGAEENITGCVARSGSAYMTQYIGKASGYGVIDFESEAIQHLVKLLRVTRPAAVALDVHPRYRTRKLAKRWLEHDTRGLLEDGVIDHRESLAALPSTRDPVPLEIQHHHAHAASLMIDSLPRKRWGDVVPVLTLDGTGYGMDGTAWGGEVLESSLTGFRRVAALRPLPLIGGEMAIKEPTRLAFALAELADVDYIALEDIDLFRKTMEDATPASGFGRLLDAVSAYLRVCTRKTYDGEPAMRLEPLLRKGVSVMNLEPLMVEKEGWTGPDWIEDGPGFNDVYRGGPGQGRLQVVDTPAIFRAMHDGLPSGTGSADLAATYLRSIMKGLVSEAVASAKEHGSRYIGLTGGVAYSQPLTETFVRMVEEAGFQPLLHDRVPPGDGGISIGQAVVALNILGTTGDR